MPDHHVWNVATKISDALCVQLPGFTFEINLRDPELGTWVLIISRFMSPRVSYQLHRQHVKDGGYTSYNRCLGSMKRISTGEEIFRPALGFYHAVLKQILSSC